MEVIKDESNIKEIDQPSNVSSENSWIHWLLNGSQRNPEPIMSVNDWLSRWLEKSIGTNASDSTAQV